MLHICATECLKIRLTMQMLWERMKLEHKLGFQFNDRQYISVLKAFGEGQSLQSLRQMFQEYLELGLLLNHDILEASIKACGRLKAFWFGWVRLKLVHKRPIWPSPY